MSTPNIRRALISVSDKSGIVELAAALRKIGSEIISTGGTAKLLTESNIPVTPIEQITGVAEMMDGRVKTLHPKIHGGVLMDRDNPDHVTAAKANGITPIDMVVVNLYPFEKTIAKPNCTFEDAIENIDIGGPCLLRAAAKNHKHVWAVPWPIKGDELMSFLRGELDEAAALALRRTLAMHAFGHTGRYDHRISEYLGGTKTLRYGENPHQQASVHFDGAWDSAEPSLLRAEQLGGGPMSFNNYVDGDAALELIKDLHELDGGKPAVAIIKHTNPCGAAIDEDPIKAYHKAYLGDPTAAAGGVLATNFAITKPVAEQIMNSFAHWGKAAGAAFFKLDMWLAPGFDQDALKLITTPTEKRKWGAQCRILAVGEPGGRDRDAQTYRHILGGFLVQQRDLTLAQATKVVTRAKPTDAQMGEMLFAMTVCKNAKSNTITITRDRQLLGNGVGQTSRLTSARLALELARENGHDVRGAVAASDAFFPVPDGPRSLFDAGVAAIIQPGGSVRDADVIAAADAADVPMIFTHTRHFKH